MNQLIPGFDFVLKHSLTRKELLVIYEFIEQGKMTLLDLGKFTNTKPKTIHKIIMTLRLKGLIEIAEKDSKGVHTYQIKGDRNGNIY